jgi:hypothetical protein
MYNGRRSCYAGLLGKEAPMRLTYALPLALAAVGCGDNTLTTNQDMAGTGGDAAKVQDLAMNGIQDMAVPVDLAMPVGDMTRVIGDANGISCGMQTCNVGEQCCIDVGQMTGTCAASCNDGSVDVMCDGPEDCSANPCCASFNLQQMNINSVMCTMMSTDCSPNLLGGQTRLCHVDGDCTDGAQGTQDPLCCTAMLNGNTTHICANMQIAMVSGGRLVCN